MNSLKNKNNFSISDLYSFLYNAFGPQGWWPADTKFEVIVGAILTQNTSWKNVEKSIKNLKLKNLLDFNVIYNLSVEVLANEIKSSGFYRQKANRLKSLIYSIHSNYGSLENFLNQEVNEARKFLLSIKGIGKETADSIILYAMDKPVFVVDSYTLRIFKRIGFDLRDYETIKMQIEKNFNYNTENLKEFHALLVELAKRYCKKSPSCDTCPINHFCEKNI
ncbi:MAG: endonuclease III domain-containing protein [Thermoplasmata archaeon]